MKKAAVIYVDGMTDADMVEDFVIRSLLKNKETAYPVTDNLAIIIGVMNSIESIF